MQSPFSGSHLCLITVEDTGPLFPLQSTPKEEVAVKVLFQTMVEHTATTQRNSPRHFSACSGFYNFAGLGRKGLLAKNIEQRGRRTRTKTGQWRPQFVARRLPLPAFGLDLSFILAGKEKLSLFVLV